MPSCWPPVAWPSLPCSTSCSDPAHRIRKTTPDVRRSPCRWTSFFCRMAGENDAPRPWPAVVRPHGRRRAHGVSVIRKKDEKERERELLREGIAAFGRDSPAERGSRQGRTGRSKAATPGLPEPAGLRRCRQGTPHTKASPSYRPGLRGRAGPMGCRVTEDRAPREGSASSLPHVRQRGPQAPEGAVPPPSGQTMPPGRRRAARTDAGQRMKKTTGCPGGGAAGQRGRMF